MGIICGLNMLKTGEIAKVLRLENKGDIRRRLFDLGIIEGSEITCVFKAPFGDPTAYMIKGTIIAIRKNDSEKIVVRCKNE